MRVNLITGLILLLPFFGFSQGEFNNWYFGFTPPIGTGVTFNSGNPIVIPNGVMMSSAVTINISDSIGNILFFSNGNQVWNKNKTIMPNGDGLNYGGTSGFRQPVLAIQKRDDDSSYYIFTAGQPSLTTTYGLLYSIVNMRLDGGLGDIEPAYKNIAVPGAGTAWQAVTGIRHKNNKDIWIVTTISSIDNINYAAYLVNQAGFNPVPILSQSYGNGNLPIPFLYKVPPKSIKISPDGSKLVGLFGKNEFCTFNSQTGQVNHLLFINSGYPSSSGSAEFSIDSKYLYLTIETSFGLGVVLQFDATKTDSVQFMQSKVLLDSGHPRAFLQMGPNWKIYGSESFKDSLCQIQNPSSHGSLCNFQWNAIGLDAPCADGLPQFVQRYKAYIHHIGSCQDIPIHFSGDIWPPPDSIHWDFGDPASGAANTSNSANPDHLYATAGTYIVELFVRHNDNRTDTSWQTITIQPAPQPALGPDQTICAPQMATFDAGACIGCTYQWDDLTTMTMNIGSGQTYTTSTPGLYRVNVTGPNGCIGRDTVQLSIGTPVSVSVTIATGSTTVCDGDQVTFTATGQPAGNSLSYQWKVNGINAGPNNSVFTYTPINGDCIVCSMTSTDACATGNPATSNQICMTVNQLNPVSLNITSTSTHICAGTPVTFNAFPTNPGNSPVYQWKVNGTNSGSNSQVFIYTPANGDCISCQLTSDMSCLTGNPALSNSICMTVDQPLPVSVTVTTPQTTVCAGTTVTFTANPTHGGSLPGYQWKVNGASIVGATNSTYAYTPLNGDIITCELTSSDNCVTGNPALSPPVIMTVTPNPAVSVLITPSANPFCPGSQVTFIAVPNHGGLFPSYLWKVNGSNAGTNSSSFTYAPLNGDVVTCELTSSDNCVTGNPATSAPVTMTASPILVVTVAIAASSNPFCAGSQVTFTATPSHGGLVPGYQWKVNGGNAGTNSPSFSYSPANGDQVSCVLNSSASCITGNPAMSNIITMIVNTNLPAGVSISTPTNPFCPGTAVTFTANPTNGGGTPSYQWKLNGVNAGPNSTTFTCNPAVGDSIRCVITSNLNCVTGNPASSGKIIMSGNPVPDVTFNACFDTVTTVNAKPFNLHGGLPLDGHYSGPGVNSITGTFTPSVAGTGLKTITYGYSNVFSCLATKTKTILVQPNPSFTCGNNLADIRDNKIYPTVQIGSQCWMAANLNYGKILNSSQVQYDNCISEKYCYNDVTGNCTKYGGLYQWDEVMKYDGTPAGQGLCPPGWHVPTESEWTTLFNFYLGNGLAGKPLQDTIMAGFRAQTSGVFYLNSIWSFNGFATLFWTSTPWNAVKAISHGMNVYDFSVSLYPSSRANAFPVRCLRD